VHTPPPRGKKKAAESPSFHHLPISLKEKNFNIFSSAASIEASRASCTGASNEHSQLCYNTHA
jgi:hypothetical protein